MVHWKVPTLVFSNLDREDAASPQPHLGFPADRPCKRHEPEADNHLWPYHLDIGNLLWPTAFDLDLLRIAIVGGLATDRIIPAYSIAQSSRDLRAQQISR